MQSIQISAISDHTFSHVCMQYAWIIPVYISIKQSRGLGDFKGYLGFNITTSMEGETFWSEPVVDMNMNKQMINFKNIQIITFSLQQLWELCRISLCRIVLEELYWKIGWSKMRELGLPLDKIMILWKKSLILGIWQNHTSP